MGYWLTLLGVLALSPDTLFIRLAGSDPWQISAWRGFLSGFILIGYCYAIGGRQVIRALKAAGSSVILGLIFVTVFSAFGFIYAITHANVTDVLVIVAFAPLISALLSALFLHEQVLLRTWIATAVCGIGLAILLSQPSSAEHWDGWLAAFISALGLAAQFVYMRSRPQTDLTIVVGFGNIISGCIAIGLASSLVLQSTIQLLGILGTSLAIPISFILFAMALRHISAAETSLIMLIESILGSFWVWLFLGELPSLSTLLGGILVLGTLTIYGVLILRDLPKAPAH
ncbi:DMT family transporter [Thiofilum flexile]|uniref:DMT family transporter n=1 Tax=Thiofilum flexile TaxID=125627 RepID=UPI000365336E|nr:DMT family transporter [Thiofilum flexile]